MAIIYILNGLTLQRHFYRLTLLQTHRNPPPFCYPCHPSYTQYRFPRLHSLRRLPQPHPLLKLRLKLSTSNSQQILSLQKKHSQVHLCWCACSHSTRQEWQNFSPAKSFQHQSSYRPVGYQTWLFVALHEFAQWFRRKERMRNTSPCAAFWAI